MNLFLLQFFISLSVTFSIPHNSVPIKTTFSFLSGTWKMKVSQNLSQNNTPSFLFEHWQLANDTIWEGFSYMITGKDSIPMEEMHIVQRGSEVLFIPEVANQNGGLPIEFVYRGFIDGGHLFENESHDYPQRIYYAPAYPDSLNARIEATVNGTLKMEKFNYGKVN